MKINKMMRIASVLLIAVILTTSVIGGTLAKYTSDVTVNAQATVAKWDIEVNDTQIAVSGDPVVTFNLFAATSIYDLDGSGNVDTASLEANIAEENGLIAPGCGGTFNFKIENNSQVDAEYTIAYTLTNNNNIPLEFSKDNIHWDSNIGSLTVNDVDIDRGEVDDTQTFYWRWAYYVDAARDTSDTTLGIYAQNPATVPSATVTATITVNQVN